jgi:hypothetical protein
MAYNMPYGTIHGPHFFDEMANSHIFPQEDMMEIQDSWMANIDPLLRAQTQESQVGWQQQQQPLQHYINQPERLLFTAPLCPQVPLRHISRHHDPISSLPQTSRARMVSPSPSQELSSTCSSARSPGAAESEWYQDNFYSPQAQNDCSLPNATSHMNQGLSDLWPGQPQAQAVPQISGYHCVNLSQVQGFADPQEVTYEPDEGYIDMDMKAEYAAIELENRGMKSQGIHTSYRHSSDEGLGASIKDEGSPQNVESINVDIDADAEADEDPEVEGDTIVAEAASDTEYSPKPTRTRKRRGSKASPPPAAKRGRVTKNTKAKLPFTCKLCSHVPFKDAVSLQRHVSSAHTRAFICVFAFAGCTSTFASKNEWKRHVSSQHLNLNAWVCELGACGKVQASPQKGSNGVVKGAEFNRKDLFTQHLRRMHAPFLVKRQNKKNAEWEDKLKELQISCFRVKRQPPTRLACPVGDCGVVFEGGNCWDDRMEHVGKHLEKAALSTGQNKLVVEQQDDKFLVDWALREGIIERKLSGGYRLCVPGNGAVEDEDADGEEE